jgi:hypothetical protein
LAGSLTTLSSSRRAPLRSGRKPVCFCGGPIDYPLTKECDICRLYGKGAQATVVAISPTQGIKRILFQGPTLEKIVKAKLGEDGIWYETSSKIWQGPHSADVSKCFYNRVAEDNMVIYARRDPDPEFVPIAV